MSIDEMIAVLEAAKRGEEIQYKEKNDNEWRVCTDPSWTFNYNDYRIKPKPRMVPLEACDVPPGSVFKRE